jgi:hypothetical protein
VRVAEREGVNTCARVVWWFSGGCICDYWWEAVEQNKHIKDNKQTQSSNSSALTDQLRWFLLVLKARIG